MGHFHIRALDGGPFLVRVADCTREHAQSVLDAVSRDPHCPAQLEVIEVNDVHGPTIPLGQENQELPEVQPKRRLLGRRR